MVSAVWKIFMEIQLNKYETIITKYYISVYEVEDILVIIPSKFCLWLQNEKNFILSEPYLRDSS